MRKRVVTIVGGGAIGGISAAYLAKAGFDVTVVDRWREHVVAMRQGLRIDGTRGELTVPLKAIEPQELKGPLDLVLLSVKSVSTRAVLKTLVPLLQEKSTVVSLQNGINEDLIAAEIGRKRTVGCMIGWGGTSVGPGHLTQTAPGVFVLGRLDGQVDDELEDVRNILSHVEESSVTSNIYGYLWLKLVINCVIATGALLAKTVGETVANKETHAVIKEIVAEGLAVTAELGICLETVGQSFTPEQYLALKEFVAERIMQAFEAEHANVFPSIYQDIQKGRKSEIDFINGHVVAKGTELGVATPLNEALVAMIHEIEDGSRSPGMNNFYQLEKLL